MEEYDPNLVLQPLLHAARESRDSNLSTIRAIVMKVLSDADIFSGYNQIKEILHPALHGAEGDKISDTLNLFSYGVYQDYVQSPEKYLNLTETQIYKLRQLTMLSIVQQACIERKASVPYVAFQDALALADVRLVEDLLVSCSRVMRGSLCQKSQALWLTRRFHLCSRDVAVDEIPRLLESLQLLQSRIAKSHSQLAAEQTAVEQDIQQHQQQLLLQKKSDEDLPLRRQKRTRGGLAAGMTDLFGRSQI